MLKIELENLYFYGYHGTHPAEKQNGGDFDVCAVVTFEPRFIPIKYLDETIDYARLYSIIKQRMAKPTELLESIATELVQEILAAFPGAEEVTVKIRKHKPQLTDFIGMASAQYSWRRAQRRS